MKWIKKGDSEFCVSSEWIYVIQKGLYKDIGLVMKFKSEIVGYYECRDKSQARAKAKNHIAGVSKNAYNLLHQKGYERILILNN